MFSRFCCFIVCPEACHCCCISNNNVFLCLLYILRVLELLHVCNPQCWQACFFSWHIKSVDIISTIRHCTSSYFIPLRVFHTSVSWWFSTGVWGTASLFKYPGLFSVFWPILIMLQSGWSLLVLWFLSLPAPLPILWKLFRAHQLQLVSLSPSCSMIFFCSLARSWYLSLFLLSFDFTQWSVGKAKFSIRQVLLFCWLLS